MDSAQIVVRKSFLALISGFVNSETKKIKGVEKYDQNVEKLYTFISIRNKKEKSSLVREKRKGITRNVGYINISNHRAKAYPRAIRACRRNEYPGISTT